ncbi:hypothetical protein BH23ACT3_BH23ACT3_03990 [soil metagenome]
MAVIAERTSRLDEGTRARGFRPSSRRRSRIAAGVALAAVAVGANLVVYSGLDRREPVLQVVRDVPAGEQLTSDHLREVEVAADASVRMMSGDQAGAVVGSYARVRLVAGSLVVADALQPDPLVSPGAAIVAIQVSEGALPIGLRERSRVRLVLTATRAADDPTPTVVDGRVVGMPSAPQSVSGRLSLSVEVAEHLAADVVANDDVRVVLTDPGHDPAGTVGGGS